MDVVSRDRFNNDCVVGGATVQVTLALLSKPDVVILEATRSGLALNRQQTGRRLKEALLKTSFFLMLI